MTDSRLRGAGPPYRSKVTKSSSRAEGAITIHSVDNFFDFGQNTVFFRCSSPELRQLWYKPDFPFNPHISLYDGKDREFATELFRLASEYEFNFTVPSSELVPLQSTKGQEVIPLSASFDQAVVSSLVGRTVDWECVPPASSETRLQIIRPLLSYLSKNSVPRSDEFSTLRASISSRMNTAFFGGLRSVLERTGREFRIAEADDVLPLLLTQTEMQAFARIAEAERDELRAFYARQLKRAK